MTHEVNIPTHFVQNNQILKQKNIDFRLISENLPKNFDTCSNFYAYIHHQINREDQLVELYKKVEESFIGQNIYTKEVAGQVINIGHQGYSKMVNYFNV